MFGSRYPCPCGLGHQPWLLPVRRSGGSVWTVDLFACGVEVRRWEGIGVGPGERLTWRTETNPILAPLGRWKLANKWITEARKRLLGSRRPEVKVDPVISDGRPALTAFLTEVEAGEGLTRERSVLMLAWDEAGMRVGLKDEAMGGWLWRQCQTLQEGLQALEEALAGGTARWGGSGGHGGRRRAK